MNYDKINVVKNFLDIFVEWKLLLVFLLERKVSRDNLFFISIYSLEKFVIHNSGVEWNLSSGFTEFYDYELQNLRSFYEFRNFCTFSTFSRDEVKHQKKFQITFNNHRRAHSHSMRCKIEVCHKKVVENCKNFFIIAFRSTQQRILYSVVESLMKTNDKVM